MVSDSRDRVGSNSSLLTIGELKTNKAAQEMLRRLNDEIFPDSRSVADTTLRNCNPDNRMPQQESQPL